ncbi:amino acid ABC transporter permease [Hydromonas duriensis]|uniref:Glutamate/aspartate import permease protein GltK n=1 Tax=Hydromonas duriensis TaxID=1527608 RepID=A0A4R6Y5W9_9BURK|nr:amino acid ABC transporter permease [Hydromonas duriensis]TDR29023.1 amino acid ABC transporter membrane protein 2 (PAAT family) [Hydromonas duriensis]
MMDFDFRVLLTADALNLLAQGLLFTVQVTVLALIGGMLLGTVLAMMRLSSNIWLSVFAKLYVDLFRGLPLVQVLLIFYFLLPKLWASVTGADYVTPLGALYAGVMTYAVFEAAYYSEIMRAGIQSVSQDQVSASYALGMSYGQSMAFIVLPQALRNMLPVLLTQTIILFQDITLVYAVGWKDFLGAGSTLASIHNRPTEFYLLVAVVYFLICFTLSSYVKRLQDKVAIIR